MVQVYESYIQCEEIINFLVFIGGGQEINEIGEFRKEQYGKFIVYYVQLFGFNFKVNRELFKGFM